MVIHGFLEYRCNNEYLHRSYFLVKMNHLTCIFQGFSLDFKSFDVVFKTFQSTCFPEHLSVAASACVETVLSKLPRLSFKNVFLKNHNRK